MKMIFSLNRFKAYFILAAIAACSTTQSLSAQSLIGFEKEQEIFSIVDEMPRFYDRLCEKLDDVERAQCAEAALFNYIKKNLRYPSLAIENKTEGSVYVKFVVDEQGHISNIETLKDLGHGCGAEAVRLLEKMPDWIPGVQNGSKVKVYYTLPVKFKLN